MKGQESWVYKYIAKDYDSVDEDSLIDKEPKMKKGVSMDVQDTKDEGQTRHENDEVPKYAWDKVLDLESYRIFDLKQIFIFSA